MRISHRQIEKMAKKMGIETTEIPAEEVVIQTKDKYIIISNPSVARVNMMGQDTFQISGEVSEQPREKEKEFTEEDVDMVAEKTGISKEDARAALQRFHGDLAETITNIINEHDEEE